jgi:hypothetical protein
VAQVQQAGIVLQATQHWLPGGSSPVAQNDFLNLFANIVVLPSFSTKPFMAIKHVLVASSKISGAGTNVSIALNRYGFTSSFSANQFHSKYYTEDQASPFPGLPYFVDDSRAGTVSFTLTGFQALGFEANSQTGFAWGSVLDATLRPTSASLDVDTSVVFQYPSVSEDFDNRPRVNPAAWTIGAAQYNPPSGSIKAQPAIDLSLSWHVLRPMSCPATPQDPLSCSPANGCYFPGWDVNTNLSSVFSTCMRNG